jgi:hypothetical protein
MAFDEMNEVVAGDAGRKAADARERALTIASDW